MSRLTALLIALGVGLAAGSSAAYKLTADHYEAAAAKQERAAAVAYAERTEQLNAVAADLERARHDRKVVYRTITRNVETYINDPLYQRDCVDERGLRDINAALAGRASAGQPAGTVPAPGAAAGDDRR